MSRLGLGRPGLVRSGWHRQQLVKLGYAEISASEHYLCFDADVLCVRPVEAGDLVRDGRAIIERSTSHPEWYERAAQLLDVPVVTERHGLTPAVLAREGVRSLATTLEARDELARPRLGSLLDRLGPGAGMRDSWLLRLVWNLPWTEYALYFTHLVRTGTFEQHHVVVPSGTMSGNNVWAGTDLDTYDPARCFDVDGAFFFTTVQSNRRIDAAEVRRWFEPWLS